MNNFRSYALFDQLNVLRITISRLEQEKGSYSRDYLRAKANKTGSEYLRQAFNHTFTRKRRPSLHTRAIVPLNLADFTLPMNGNRRVKSSFTASFWCLGGKEGNCILIPASLMLVMTVAISKTQILGIFSPTFINATFRFSLKYETWITENQRSSNNWPFDFCLLSNTKA